MKPALFPRTNGTSGKRASAPRPAAERIPVPHPSWFGKLEESRERLAPDQFWTRLGL